MLDGKGLREEKKGVLGDGNFGFLDLPDIIYKKTGKYFSISQNQ